MKVDEIWRYPVKSMGGEQLEHAAVSAIGIDGDRRWGILDNETGMVLTAKRDGRLLMASSALDRDGHLVVTLPDGTECDESAPIAEWLDKDVSLVAASSEGGRFENPRDFEEESDWIRWQGPAHAWHDMKRARVSLVSRDSIGDWDSRRFRANLVLSSGDEDCLVGHTVGIGSAVLTVEKKLDRCIMVTRAQPGLPRDLSVLTDINKSRATFLAVGALVQTDGEFSTGANLQLSVAQTCTDCPELAAKLTCSET